MGFNEFMNSIFGADWLGTVVQLLSSVALIWITKIYSNVKVRLLNSDNKNAKMVGELLENNIKINNKLLEVQNENTVLKEEVKQTSDSVCKLINIVSLAFIDSRGISSETKLAISKVIGEIEATGVDLKPINEMVDKANTVAEAVDKTLEKATEEFKKISENQIESVEASEGIKETSLDIYNTILENANEQQA